MNKKIIFLSIDRLGDYLIRSNVINKISKNYKSIEIITSDKNFKLANSQSFFNKVYLFNTKNKFYEKLRFIKYFLFSKYTSIIVFDGKNISNILLFLINADFKFTFIYKKKGFLNFIYLIIFSKIYKLLNIKYEILLSKNLINDSNFDNYPQKYKKLKKYYSNIDSNTYYLEKTNIKDYDFLINQFIILHLDEKFIDIKDINNNFQKALTELQKKINKKIFLTSFNNNFKYYNNLFYDKINFKSLNKDKLIKSNILIIEDMPLNHLQNLMNNSLLNISCHSGLFVHTSLSLNKDTLDIIHYSEINWFNTWIDDKKKYKQIFKSKNEHTHSINEILNNLYEEFKKI